MFSSQHLKEKKKSLRRSQVFCKYWACVQLRCVYVESHFQKSRKLHLKNSFSNFLWVFLKTSSPFPTRSSSGCKVSLKRLCRTDLFPTLNPPRSCNSPQPGSPGSAAVVWIPGRALRSQGRRFHSPAAPRARLQGTAVALAE